MQNSENSPYQETNFHILENKVEDLIEVMKNLKEKNNNLQNKIHSDLDNNKQNRINKKKEIKEKIENMIEELDSII